MGVLFATATLSPDSSPRFSGHVLLLNGFSSLSLALYSCYLGPINPLNSGGTTPAIVFL